MINNTFSRSRIKLSFKKAKNDVGTGIWLVRLTKAKDGTISMSKLLNVRLKSNFVTSDVDM